MSERRTIWLLVLVLVAQLLLLASQVADPSGAAGSRLEAVSLRLVAPVARLVSGLEAGVADVGDYLALRSTLAEENVQLKSEVRELRRRLAELGDLEQDFKRLSAAVSYSRAWGAPLVAADIVHIDHVSWLQTLILRVEAAGIRINQPVVIQGGLVGRVVVVAPPYVKVQLITDRAASVGAMIRRTRRQGLVRGRGGGQLVMEFVPLQEDVRAGDQIVTAGIDGVFPRGIPVGTVTAVSRGPEAFHEIELTPAVDFGELDQVYVLARPSLPDDVKEAVPGASP